MRAAIARLRTRGEGGFTLAELLVALTIQGLIMGALAMAFVGIMRGGTQVNESLDKTGDARIAAHYIVSDARNSSGPELSLTDTSSCPDPSPPVSGTASPVVRFNWSSTDSDGDTVANIVNYVLVGNSLLRRQCVGGALMSDRAVASEVQDVDVTCSPNADCSGSPTSITVAITATADADGTSYEYELTGTFRKLIGDGPPSNPKSIILLGTGGSCASGATGISLSNNAGMRVYGDAYINTVDGASCPAMYLYNNATYTAGGTEFLTGGSCSAGNNATCPPSGTYTTPLTDPYAGLTPPSTSGMPVRTGCSGGVAQPGFYSSGFTISSDCSLTSGVYVVQNGMTLHNNVTLTTGAGGVLLYLVSGAFTSSNNTSVSLTAMTSGPYNGVAFWQAAANTNGITFENNIALSVAGALYAPSATLSFENNSVTPYITQIVVKALVVYNNGSITVGSPSVAPLSITSTSPLPGWTVNRTGYSSTVGADGGDGLYTFSAINLPAGLTIDADSGEISGTPTATGTRTVTVMLADQLGDDPAMKNLSITINAAPSISTASLPNGSVGYAYSTTLAASAGTSPLAWSATGLPSGLTIDSASGTISGTPTASGTSSVNVTVTDASGATDTNPYTLTVSSPPTISSVTLVNKSGGIAGRVEQGDSIRVVFSTTMKVSRFCSTWSNDANDQVLNGNNQVTVTLTNASPDRISVSSTGCTFNFGTISLGSNSYTSSNRTFRGTGSNKSTITWTASTRTLLITLGQASGSTSTVASSTPVYTASGSIQDSTGGTLANSPFTLSNGAQF
jgi:hypothetical protein